MDHITRLADGGHPTDPANLQTLCRVCHIAKTRAENGPPQTDATDAWRQLVESYLN